MLTIGRIFAGEGWRYLWDQVGGGAEDYYLLDVARGEAPGRWGGTAAEPELGLSGEVSEEQMRLVFGRLSHPLTETALGSPPRTYRSVEERIEAARALHDTEETARWAQRELALLEAGAGPERIDTERAAFRGAAGERWATREAAIRRGGQRRAVAGFDLTFSAPKSLSVLWAAAPPEGRQKIWVAHHEGVAAAMVFVEREAALSRTGYAGIRQVDSTGLVTASFDHRMSRAGDAHVHTHTATLNRVRCADGEWRALDGRAVYRVAAAAGAIYDRVRESALERDLGVRHEPDPKTGAREIVGVDPELRRLFSSRRVQIEGRLAELVETWTDQHGSDPSEWLVTRMSEWARLDTRARKGPGETTAAALERWDRECRAELGRSLAAVWDTATRPAIRPGQAGGRNPNADNDTVACAVAALDTSRSTWTRYDLARELTRGITVDPRDPPEAVLSRVDRLVGAALQPGNAWGVVSLAAPAVFTTPAALRRSSDDTSFYAEHGATRYSTNAGLAIERRLLSAARDTTGPRVEERVIAAAVAARSLDDDQAGVIRAVLGSGRRVDAIVGPAGAGKTTTMGAIARAWTTSGAQVLGVSIAENATRVLAGHAGVRAVNAAKLIFEHTRRPPERQAQQWWQQSYAIGTGALVILDEAGMASRQSIDQLAAICARAGAKLLLVGDPDQLASPDAGGAFALVVDHVGAAALAQVRRFAQGWERAASLRLRNGDPSVLDEYDRRGRITGGSAGEAEDAAFAAAMADRARGLSVYLLADTNDIAARLAGRVRERLVATGAVGDTHTVALADGNRAGVGDQVVTRDNDRLNRTSDDRFVANRDLWSVRAVTSDGELQVARVDTDHTLDLDAAYVADRVQLAYASTVHAAQGGTRDVAHTVLTPSSTRTAAYVGLTRGREENHAYVVCTRPEGADCDGPAQDPLAVLGDILERPDPPEASAALTVQADEATRAVSLATLFPVWQDLLAEDGTRHAYAAMAAIGGPDLAGATLASPAWPALAARLRRLENAGIDPAAALAGAAAQHPLDDAEDLAAVLHWRLRHTDAATTAPHVPFAQLTPHGPGEVSQTASQVAAAMDARTVVLARQVEADPPTWAGSLGPRPTEPDGSDAWLARAGVVAGYREAFGIDTPDDPIGPPPAPGRPDAHAWWTRAAAALSNSETQMLAGLPTERLEAIIDHAHTHLAGGPLPVTDQLRRATTALRSARTTQGNALAGGDTDAARIAGEQADRLARQVDRLEDAQARREAWSLAAARLDTQATAAQAALDARQAARQARPYAGLDTDTLLRRLRNSRIRATRATDTADRYDQRAEHAIADIDRLMAAIDHTATIRPGESRARETVLVEQHVAARIAHLQSDLDRSRLGHHVVLGPRRIRLSAELNHLRQGHPALTAADPRIRWDALLAEGETADAQARENLQAEHGQAVIDLTWYRNTAAQLRADADHQRAATIGIQSELAVRSQGCDVTSTARPDTPAARAGRGPDAAHSAYVAQQQLTDLPSPPQDAPGSPCI
ncbi:MAG: MobF family relaxase [Acidimicrobiales bacterium]